MNIVNIVPYCSEFASDFKDLNIAWLEAYFYVEPYDLEVLSYPEKYIIAQGGQIFFSMTNKIVTGTFALMPVVTGVFELTKMAVRKENRGQGIGQELLAHAIAFAKEQQHKKLVLYSNTTLENAIYLYKQWGFCEAPLEDSSNYERANIKMELVF